MYAPLVGDRGLRGIAGSGRHDRDPDQRLTGLGVAHHASHALQRGRLLARRVHAIDVVLVLQRRGTAERDAEIVPFGPGAHLVRIEARELLGPLGLGIRRDAGRRCDREAVLAGQQVAVDRPHAPQVVAERERGARPDPDQHALPVLGRRVVDDRPALEHHPVIGPHHHPVAGLPRRRLGDVGEEHVGVLHARGLERHGQVAAVVRLLSRDGDRQRLTSDRIDDGQRLQEVIDPVAGHVDGELAVAHLGVALVERDAVPVNDDAPEDTSVDMSGVGVGAGREQDRCDKAEGSHGL